MNNENKSTYQTLLSIDISKNIVKRKSGYTELSYLSWAFAWNEVKKTFADANYKIREYEGRPYLFDENLGYLVTTEVTIAGETISMSLPVMDSANKAMTNKQYEYTTKAGKKTVVKATMFDINKSIMRCLVKNIAMFGLGITLYLGEDLPETKDIQNEAQKSQQEKKLNEIKKAQEEVAEVLVNKLTKGENIDFEKWSVWLKQAEPVLSTETKDKINSLLNNHKPDLNHGSINLDEIELE